MSPVFAFDDMIDWRYTGIITYNCFANLTFIRSKDGRRGGLDRDGRV